MMTEMRGASNRKAKSELGWSPLWATWRDGFREGLSADSSFETRAELQKIDMRKRAS